MNTQSISGKQLRAIAYLNIAFEGEKAIVWISPSLANAIIYGLDSVQSILPMDDIRSKMHFFSIGKAIYKTNCTDISTIDSLIESIKESMMSE